MDHFLCALFADDGKFLTAGVREADAPVDARLEFEEDNEYTMSEYGTDDTEVYEFPFALSDLSRAKAWIPDGTEEKDAHYDIFGIIGEEHKHVLGCRGRMETRTVLSTLKHDLGIPCRIRKDQPDDS